jgi:hypothetical protein
MASSQKSSRRRAPADAPLDGLYDYGTPPVRAGRRRAKYDAAAWIVTDDWRQDVPVTEAEIDVFESWFGDVFDKLFGED